MKFGCHSCSVSSRAPVGCRSTGLQTLLRHARRGEAGVVGGGVCAWVRVCGGVVGRGGARSRELLLFSDFSMWPASDLRNCHKRTSHNTTDGAGRHGSRTSLHNPKFPTISQKGKALKSDVFFFFAMLHGWQKPLKIDAVAGQWHLKCTLLHGVDGQAFQKQSPQSRTGASRKLTEWSNCPQVSLCGPRRSQRSCCRWCPRADFVAATRQDPNRQGLLGKVRRVGSGGPQVVAEVLGTVVGCAPSQLSIVGKAAPLVCNLRDVLSIYCASGRSAHWASFCRSAHSAG